MKKFFRRAAGVMMSVALATGSASAADFNAVSYDQQFASYSERLETLEAELASLATGGDSYGKDSGGKGGDCGPTMYVRAEMPWLQVHDSGLVIDGIPLQTPTYGQQPAIRVLGGIERANGLGFRVTGYYFEDSASGFAGPIPLGASTEVYSVDLELTQRGQFCGWDLLVMGGVRIAGIDQELSVVLGGPAVSVSREFDGAGLTAGFEVARQLGQSPLSVYSGFRGSLLFGEADINLSTPIPPLNGTIATVPNTTIAVWEIQLGVEYRRCMRYGTAIVRAGVEGQMWEQPSIALGLLDSNVGFFGPTFALGFER
jgi:hypothetical protein